ncbi:hypothetical protein [Saliphagus infecundisoli]|uniref:Uncharacterized protein n=1 Tax=Saliphagus infecundisoli TaxID=1849069 RepID=A0ABD5QGL1_9EURY|nr:hypothetical protein [Saliphagus infecundisoli]
MGDASQWLHGLWRFYLGYTDRPVHAASAALLAIFGILVFVDPLFAILAVAAYIAPPVILYIRADDPEAQASRHRRVPDRDPPAPRGDVGREPASSGGRRGAVGDAGSDSDADSDGTDADSDSDGGDGDSDSDGTDTDSDGDDGDTNSDSDGTDTDTDSDG